MNKNITRQSILKELDYIKTSFLAKADGNDIAEPMILMQGDLQDTVTRTEKDNVIAANSKKQNPLGVLDWMNQAANRSQEFVSIVRENLLECESYITRQ